MFFRRKENLLKSEKRAEMEKLEELRELRDNAEFEKGDFLAILIAALTTIVPFVLVVLLGYYVISMLIFG